MECAKQRLGRRRRRRRSSYKYKKQRKRKAQICCKINQQGWWGELDNIDIETSMGTDVQALVYAIVPPTFWLGNGAIVQLLHTP